MKTFCFAAVTSTAALLAASAGADVPGSVGPETPLLEAKAPDGALVSFVPSGSFEGRYLISTPEDAKAWRKWAETSHPGKAIALQWDVEPFDLEVADADLLAWVREGDEGADPAGRFRYAVVSNPVPTSGKVSLLLKNAPDAKDFAPDCCASNVWLLSRDTLFDRWKESARQGGAADVRRAFRSLDRRLGSSPEWRAAADTFAAGTSGLYAVVRFRNGRKTPVRVRIGGTPKTLAADETWEWTPRADAHTGSVSWEARDVGDERSADDDWTWSPKAEIAGFDPMGEDVDVPLSGSYGSLKPLPFLEFPDGALPDGAVRAELQYAAGDPEHVPVVTRNGMPAVECEPGRPVRQCVVRLDGWKDGIFAPEGGIATIARGQSLKLKRVGAPMERNLPPWKDGAVRIVWNGFEGKVRLRVEAGKIPIVDETLSPNAVNVPIPLSGQLDGSPVSETDVVVSWWSGAEKLGEERVAVRRGASPDAVRIALPAPPPKFPWPDSARIVEAKNWFSADEGLVRSPLYYLSRESNYPDFKIKWGESKRILFHFLGFRPYPIPGRLEESAIRTAHEKTFDAMVAHIEGCSGCWAHRNGRPASAEALAFLLPAEGKTSVESLAAWPKEGNFRGFVKDWWKECTHVLGNVFDVRVDAKSSLKAAVERWNGEGDPRKPKTMFAEAYVHIVCCGGCDRCRPFRDARDAMLKEETFEARRAALFRALMKHDWNWDPKSRPTDEDIDEILKKFPTSRQSAP